MDETILQVIFYVVIFIIYLVFGGKKKKKTQKTVVPNQRKVQNSTSKPSKPQQDILSDFLSDIEKYIEDPNEKIKNKSLEEVKPTEIETQSFHSLEQESKNYDKTSINYDTEAISHLGEYNISTSPIQQDDKFFIESEKALSKPANRHLTKKKKNQFKELLKDKDSVKKAIILNEIFQRKYD